MDGDRRSTAVDRSRAAVERQSSGPFSRVPTTVDRRSTAVDRSRVGVNRSQPRATVDQEPRSRSKSPHSRSESPAVDPQSTESHSRSRAPQSIKQQSTPLPQSIVVCRGLATVNHPLRLCRPPHVSADPDRLRRILMDYGRLWGTPPAGQLHKTGALR